MTCPVCGQPHQRERMRAEPVVEDDPDLMPWHEVGAALGVSGRRACQIADAAMAKLRLLAVTEELR